MQTSVTGGRGSARAVVRSRALLFSLCLLTGLSFSVDAFAKKDFKGLFGSYRRERFTENEGNDTDFGVDLSLSTLIPVSPVAQSSENGSSYSNMNFALSFNYEASFFFTLGYNWEITASAGYYNYSSRKQNTQLNTQDPSLNASPLFHQFDMTLYPVMLGVKYRLSRHDVVPYFGISGGAAFVTRKGYYDYSNISSGNQSVTALTGRIDAGLEFYFAPRAGIRLEMGVSYIGLPDSLYDPTPGLEKNNPAIDFKSNLISVRYASGIFFLF